jgi:spore coat protein H
MWQRMVNPKRILIRASALLIAVLAGLIGGIHLSPWLPWLDPAAPAKATEPPRQEKHRQESDAFFNGPILRIRLEVSPGQVERLQRDERNYVEATVKAGDRSYKKVGLKLKGSAGSFQGFDAKPGLTLHFHKFRGSKRFHGMKKLHLNNGAQDGTYLQEAIAGEVARKAGVPASRCTHALVELNGRDLGLYVVKEAFTEEFLAHFFPQTHGDLWDGGFVREIDEGTEKDSGDPADTAALKELIAACQEQDPDKRWQLLDGILDIDQFISYRALESILGHWDGYSFNRNNYRFYRDPATGKFVFFLHGMDQTWAEPGYPVFGQSEAMVSSAVMRSPPAEELYLKRLDAIYRDVLMATDWPRRVEEIGEKVRAAIAAPATPESEAQAADYANRIAEAKSRVEERIKNIGEQLAAVPRKIVFDEDGVLKLPDGWRAEGAAAAMEQVKIDNKPALHIRAEGTTTASYRKNLALSAGRYRFAAKVRASGVEAAEGGGIVLRISGSTPEGSWITGANGWREIAYEFESTGAEVVLVAELKAASGDVWFDLESLQVEKLSK